MWGCPIAGSGMPFLSVVDLPPLIRVDVSRERRGRGRGKEGREARRKAAQVNRCQCRHGFSRAAGLSVRVPLLVISRMPSPSYHAISGPPRRESIGLPTDASPFSILHGPPRHPFIIQLFLFCALLFTCSLPMTTSLFLLARVASLNEVCKCCVAVK